METQLLQKKMNRYGRKTTYHLTAIECSNKSSSGSSLTDGGENQIEKAHLIELFLAITYAP